MTARESGENDNSLESIVLEIQKGHDPDGKRMLELLSGTERFARMIARPFIPSVIDESELQSISFLAMSEAVRLFDPIAGAGILTVFRWTLTRELINETTRSGAVYIPHHLLKRLRAFRQARKNLMQELSSEPPDIVLAHHMGITVAEVREIRRVEHMLAVRSLDAPVDPNNEDMGTLGDIVPDDARVENDVIDEVYLDGLHDALDSVLRNLPEDERSSVTMHYCESMTYAEISEKTGTSTETARQRCFRGLRKMRNHASGLRQFVVDYNFTNGTSFSTWNRTGSSATERFVIWQEERMERKSRPDDFMESTKRFLQDGS